LYIFFLQKETYYEMREIELRLTWIENQENLLDGVAIKSIL